MRSLRGWAVLLMLLAALALPCTAGAMPAYPGEITMTEPATGRAVTGYQVGDEFFSYCTDAQGALLELDADGYFRHVVREGDGYALGGYVTQSSFRLFGREENIRRGDAGLREKLTALREELYASVPMLLDEEETRSIWGYDPLREQSDAASGRWRAYHDIISPGEYAPRGATVPLLVLKLNYTNVRCAFDDAAWHKRVFDDGVSAFYTENSGGRFTYVPAQEGSGTANDGVVSVTLPFMCPSYMANSGIGGVARGIYEGTDGKTYGIANESMLFAYALVLAEDAVDFAAYDTNGDGRIDPTELAVTVIQPGLEAAVSRYAADRHAGVWAHSSTISTFCSATFQYNLRVCVDGVQLYKYTIMAENTNASYTYPGDEFVRGDEYIDDDPNVGDPGYRAPGEGTAQEEPLQAQFGTLCHELGHDLGLKDLYNVLTGDDSICGAMSLMSAGGWGAREGEASGSCPSHLDPYSKAWLGFYTETELEENGATTLYAAADSAHYGILKIPSGESGVCFLVENRQFAGFDAGLFRAYGGVLWPLRGGLVIWRINERVIEQGWDVNGVNSDSGDPGVMTLFTQDDPYSVSAYEATPFYREGMGPMYLEMNSELAVEPRGEGNVMRAVVTGFVPRETPEPTATPTAEPTATPTAEPTATPTAEPTATPTAEPTATPTAEPTATPTAEPTATPTAEPTATPTAEPTSTPLPPHSLPQTGDSSHPALWLVLLAVSCAGLIGVLLAFRGKGR